LDAKNNSDNKTVTASVIGGIIVAVLLIVTSIWISRSAQESTSAAVQSVSNFYLQELSEYSKQIVESNINKSLRDMHNALETINAADLQSQAALQVWLGKMERLCDTSEFAVVTENKRIYTARENLTVLENVQRHNSPKLAAHENEIVISIPVNNLNFLDTKIISAYMKVDFEQALGRNSEEHEGSICNLYTRTGKPLTNFMKDKFSGTENIFSAMKDLNFDDGSIYKMQNDFSNGTAGTVSYNTDSHEEIIFYTPIKHTDWILTCLIREDKIGGQIETFSDKIVSRGRIQTALIIVAMVIICYFIIRQARETSRLIHEKEISDATNKVKRDELAEKLALQNKIIEEERRRHRQDEMIRALSSDYRTVYHYNLDTDEANCYRSTPGVSSYNEGDKLKFSEFIIKFIENFVTPADRSSVRRFMTPDNLRERLKTETLISKRFLANRFGKEYYAMIRVARIDDSPEIHAVGVGFADVDEQTRESMAQNQALTDALAQAQQANISKTTFLSNMSHDIRTPMNAIIGFTTMALRNFENQVQVKDSLEKVLTSGKHLLGLINDILDMSRIESGRVEVQEEDCNLSELVHSLIHIIQPQVTAKEQNFQIDAVQIQNEDVLADKLKINQILINLLSNATKYTQSTGTINFTIIQRDSYKPGYATYEFHVKDNGMGMSEEFLKTIFEPFEREASSTKSGIQGTGLGMTITKKMVELMGGDISVTSKKGEGSEFIVTLDLKLSETAVPIQVNNLEGLHALIVDDDFHTCDSLTEMLNQIGMRSEWTTSPREAIFRTKKAINDKDPFNVYIVDWLMPELNGIETVRQIRKMAGDGPPIIILTAYDYTDIIDEAKTAGATGFCTKPLFPSDLKKALARAVGHIEEEADKPDELSETSFKGKRVLLVEDIEVNREIAKMVLSEMELEIDEALDGTDAVEIFGKSPLNYYDAVLMDIQMPTMNGYEATRAIRKLNRADSKTVPIIAMTANAFDEDKNNVLAAGMNDHIAKPLDIPQLLATLKKYLS